MDFNRKKSIVIKLDDKSVDRFVFGEDSVTDIVLNGWTLSVFYENKEPLVKEYDYNDVSIMIAECGI